LTFADPIAMKPFLEGCAPLLQVFDMPRSVRFYRDVFGFQLAEHSAPRGKDDFDWCLLRMDHVELMLNTAYEFHKRPAAPDPHRVAGHDDIALFFGCRDLDGAYHYLSAQGVVLDPPAVATYGMKQLWLRDPDRYVICLQWPARENEAA
jgi:catechol 2,3-dioxygenase-like lactoylglutathione lyase family enzyme